MGISQWIKDDTFLERRKFTDYICGLIRHEVTKGADDDNTLKVLSKIYSDLIYVENLETAENWKRAKGKDALDLALVRLQKAEEELAALQKEKAFIKEKVNNSMVKKDIIDLIQGV